MTAEPPSLHENFILQTEQTISSLKADREALAQRLTDLDKKIQDAYDILRRLKMPLPAAESNSKPKGRRATRSDYLAGLAALRESGKTEFASTELAEIIGCSAGAVNTRLKEFNNVKRLPGPQTQVARYRIEG